MLRQLDHVVMVVRDLDSATDDYRRRGFTVTPGGEHADGLTHNALIPFADGSYLELVAFHEPRREVTHRWWKIAADGGGLADFALLSDDLAADASALGGLVANPPAQGGRTRPDGTELKWRTAVLVPPLPSSSRTSRRATCAFRAARRRSTRTARPASPWSRSVRTMSPRLSGVTQSCASAARPRSSFARMRGTAYGTSA